MTLLQLHYINEICKCGSINKAAQNLFVSQSSLSSSIRELEEELGITVFNRSNRGISVTEDGTEFLRYIEPIINQHKVIKDVYSEKIATPTLHKFAISAQRYPFCAKAFVDFLSRHQSDKFRFSLKETNMYQVIENVANKHSEVGILSITDNRRKFMKKIFAIHDVEYIELIKTKTRVFLRTGHPLVHKKDLCIKDLLDYPYVIFENNESSSINFSEEAISPENHNFNKVIYVNDRATSYNIMAYTDGFSTGSGILSEGFADERITSVALKEDNANISIGYIKYISNTLSNYALEFIDLLKEDLKNHI